MKQLIAFVRLSRFTFLIGGLAGGALGTAIAFYERGSLSFGAYALAQFTVTAAHYMTQLSNEYYDRESDALTVRTSYSGGSGALVDGSLDPRVALYAAYAVATASVAGTIALALCGHAISALLAAVIIPLAWAYSAPPLRLLARGLGELDAMLVVAVLLPLCTYAAQTGNIDLRAVATMVPGAFAMLAMMIAVQIPDYRADLATGKRNAVVRLGERRAARLGLAGLLGTVGAIPLARLLGAPLVYREIEAFALIPILLLAYAFVRIARGRPFVARDVAMLGVGTYTMVIALGMLAFVAAAP